MRADEYTGGDYVLHLESGAVVFADVMREHLFHLGKPISRFGRYTGETYEGK